LDVSLKFRLDASIPCGDADLEKAVFKKILEYAKKDIFILDGNLNQKIYEDSNIVDSAKRFLQKDESRLLIALDDFASIEDVLESFFVYKLTKEKNIREKFKLYDARECSDFRRYIVIRISA
jgi:hypothetical protein